MTQLTICNIEISTDANGLYRLNDLHKASGGLPKNEPSQWLRNQKTQDLIKACEAITMQKCIVTINGGNSPGTYICEELVTDYASWISPEFKLLVYRTFKAAMTGKLQTQKPMSKDDMIDQMYLNYVETREQNKLLEAVIEYQQPCVEFVETHANINGSMGINEFCKSYNGKPTKAKQRLLDLGLLIKNGHNRYEPSSKAIKEGWMFSSTDRYGNPQVHVTNKGQQAITKKLKDRCLKSASGTIIAFPVKTK